MNALPTPDLIPSGRVRLVIEVPDSAFFVGALRGLLLELADPSNYVKHGLATAGETAEAWSRAALGEYVVDQWLTPDTLPLLTVDLKLTVPDSEYCLDQLRSVLHALADEIYYVPNSLISPAVIAALWSSVAEQPFMPCLEGD